MTLKDIFNKKTVFSLEVFPPHTIEGTQKLIHSLSGIQSIKPDFISITIGAGFAKSQKTIDLATRIQNEIKIPTMTHLSGMYLSKAEVRKFLSILKDKGIENVLALRGDRVADQEPSGDFNYASDLANFIKQNGDFDVAGACYPQKHPESQNFVEDIFHLKEKIDSGVSHLITQMIFNNQYFYEFKERAELAGIHVPIEVGIMPCINRKQIERMAKLSGLEMPQKFTSIMEHYGDNEEAMRDAGIAYAIDQIVDLVANGVDGIHLYTMNNAENAQRIWDATHNLFEANNN